MTSEQVGIQEKATVEPIQVVVATIKLVTTRRGEVRLDRVPLVSVNVGLNGKMQSD